MDSDRTVVATWTPTSLDVALAFGSPGETITVKGSDGQIKFVCSSSDPTPTCSDNSKLSKRSL